VGLSCITALSGVAASGEYGSHNNDHGYGVITRDICIVGGGAAGTYAAFRLGDMHKSVMVIEHTDRLGGNTETFTDPVTKAKADIGVQVWHNLDIVKNFFSRFKVPLTTALEGQGSKVEYIDFSSGAQLNGYPGNQGNITAALQAYAAQLAKYPFLDAGIELPDPVPTDLLMPFGDFVAKYNLSAAMTVLMDYPEGFGNIASHPTLYFMKVVGLTILDAIQNGFLTTARHDNSEIYRNAQAALLAADSLLLNSSVMSTDRRDENGLVTLRVSTPSGLKVIKVKKIIFAIPPTLDNLRNFDTDSKEHALFKQFSTTGYYTGLLRNSGIPASIDALHGRGLDTKYHIAKLPSIYSITASTIPGLRQVFYGSDTILPSDQVMDDIIYTVQRLFPNATATAPPEFAVFSSHSPFLFTVPRSAIEAGFYRNLNKLQGYRHMYYTGAAFQTQDSSLIWQFTETLLPHVVT
jgi:hypothetical protein